MTTKDKIKLIRLDLQRRKIEGHEGLSDEGRLLKGSVYADVIYRHDNALGKFRRVVKAVNNLISI